MQLFECVECDTTQENFNYLAVLRFIRFTVIKGCIYANVPSRQDQVWIRLWKENAPELRERVVGWRKQNAVTRIDKPSRIQRARRLGYKAKQGIIVVRMRVGTGGMRKQRPTGGRRPKHLWCYKNKGR